MYCCNPHGRQQLDYVLLSSKHKIPTLLTNRSLQARLNEPDESFGIFDMGNHEPVYARIEFPEIEHSSSTVNTCIGETVVLNTYMVNYWEDYGIEWTRNGTITEKEKSETLHILINNLEDIGKYTATYTYEYFPDTVINNFYDPSYMDYHWYFRGKTKGEIVIEFEINPKSIEESCSGISTSVQTHEWKNITIYPNPAKNNIVIKGLDPQAIKEISIIDIMGRKIHQISSIETELIEINTQLLNNGIYYILGKNDTGDIYRKNFAIQK